MSDTRLPNFLVIGAMKAGTTSLYHYLRAHPQVHMPPVKELDFFVEEGNWRRGMGWYAKQFEGAPAAAVAVGEASTRYTKYPSVQGVPERIAAHLPEVRLVYVVRDPIERIRSHYEHRRAAGAETEPIERAVRDNPIYVDSSRYAMQLERYLDHFPRDRVLVLTSEELRTARQEAVQRLYGFLGVATDVVPDVLDVEFYRTSERASYSPAGWWVRRTLKRHFPATKRAKELVDSVVPRLAGVARRSGGHGGESALTVPDGLRSELAAALHDDVRRLRGLMPTGFDGWGIG